MVLAIEPMVNVGGPEARVLDDKWTAVTEDGTLQRSFRALCGGNEKWAGDSDGVGGLPGKAAAQ